MDKATVDQLNQVLEKHQYNEALTYCHRLMEQGDDSSHLKAVKGWCLYKEGSIKEAEEWLLKAFNQDNSHHNTASLTISYLMEQAKYRDVIAFTQGCIAFHHTDRLMWHRLATAHFLLGDNEGAVMAFRRSLKAQHSQVTSFGLSQPLLCKGEYTEGLELYEHRFESHASLNWIQYEKLPMPKWQGEPLAGKALLVWSEQGLGDSIQFSRIIIKLVEQGASVDLFLQKQHGQLAELLQTLPGIGAVVTIDDNRVVLSRQYDFHSPLMSLMKGINLTLETIPLPDFPYLSVPSAISTAQTNDTFDILHQTIASHAHNNLKVGIVWSTALTESFKQKDFMHFSLKDKKSLRPDDIAPVLAMEGITFYSLHVAKSEAVQYMIDRYQVVDMAPHINNFVDTATIIDAMDLVISVDTSVVHLASALNKPTLNLLMYAADWRWQMHREDSPWYPSMRLLRQPALDNWKNVSQRLCQILRDLLQEYQASGTVNIWQRPR